MRICASSLLPTKEKKNAITPIKYNQRRRREPRYAKPAATGGVTSTIKCMPNPRLCVQEQHFRIEAHLRRQVIYQHPLYTCLHSLLYTFYRGVQVSTGQEHTGT